MPTSRLGRWSITLALAAVALVAMVGVAGVVVGGGISADGFAPRRFDPARLQSLGPLIRGFLAAVLVAALALAIVAVVTGFLAFRRGRSVGGGIGLVLGCAWVALLTFPVASVSAWRLVSRGQPSWIFNAVQVAVVNLIFFGIIVGIVLVLWASSRRPG